MKFITLLVLSKLTVVKHRGLVTVFQTLTFSYIQLCLPQTRECFYGEKKMHFKNKKYLPTFLINIWQEIVFTYI